MKAIVVVDKNWAIGKDGCLPWKIKADLQYFKILTTKTQQPGLKNAVIMGRRTWESIPQKFRPLPDRLNFVVSNITNLSLPPDVLKVPGVDAALDLLQVSYAQTIENIYVIGGAQLYQTAINHAQCRRIYLTRISQHFNCDAFFPKDLSFFRMVSSSPKQEDGGVTFWFEIYERIK